MARVILVEATARNAATGGSIVVRMAGGGARHYTHMGHVDWSAGVMAPPKITSLLGFDASGFTSGAIPSVSGIGFMPSRPGRLAQLAALDWSNATVVVSSGDDSVQAPAWIVDLAGTVAGYTIERGVFTFTLSDMAGKLAKPLIPTTFAGTGGTEGLAEAAGRAKRRSWGECWNVEGRLLDKANNIYEFGDPGYPILAHDVVKDKGRAGPVVAVASAGSPSATLAALIATTAPQGGCASAPSINCVKWYTQPSGPLTADLRGETTPAYADTVAGIAALISRAAGGPVVSGLASLDAIRPHPAGVHVDDASETAAAVLDRLLLRASLAWGIDGGGGIDIAPVAFADPVATVRGTIEREAAYAPATAIEVGYRRNHRRHSDAEISAAVLASDVLLLDGRTSEAALATLATQIAQVVADGWLSPGEKSDAIIRWRAVVADRDALAARYVALGSPADLTTAKAAAEAAVAALLTYLEGLAPASSWDDTSTTTAIPDPSAYRDAWVGADQALSVLRAAITGRKGDPGAGAITLVADSATTIVGANFARGTAGGGWGTDAAHSQEAYTGGAVASFTFPAIDGDNWFAAGLSQGDPGSAGGNSFTTISFAIIRNPETGSTLAYINGEGVGAPGPVVTGPGVGRVHFDGRYVRWYVNNALIHTFDWMVGTYDPYDPINALRFRAAFAGDGAVGNITLVPAGRIGNDGLPGEAGEDGRTPYTHYAYANSADGAVDFVVGAPQGRTYEGRYSDYTPADSDSPATYTWRQYLGPPFGLATRGAAVIAGTQVVKNGGAFVWDADAFSTVGFRGAAVASASPGQVNLDLMFGLNTDPLTDSSFASLDYAFFFQANGQLTLYESGSNVATLGAYSTTSTYQVSYDGRSVRYLVDGAVAREVPVASDKLFYFDSSFYSPGARLQGISFAAAGPAGVTPMTFELTKTAVIFTATYNGVLKDGQVPYTIGMSAKRGSTSLNAGVTLNLTTSSGVTASRLDDNNIQITAVTNDGTVTINGTFPDGSALPTKQIAVSRQLDAAPPQSATGASSSIQCVNNTTSYVESGASGIMNLATDSSGKITLNAYTVYNSVGTPSNLTMAFRFEYRLAGASSWIAVAETQGSMAQRYAASTGEPPDAGQWGQTFVLTGLSASSPYQFRVNGRKVSGSSSSANAGGVMKATVG